MFQNLTISYFLIPLITIIIAYFGRIFNEAGMMWYKTLNKPGITPPDYVFGIVWPILYVLTAWAAILFWNRHSKAPQFWTVIALFIGNALLNVGWTFLFFYHQSIGMALLDCFALVVITWMLVYYIWPLSRFIAILLVPYAAWVTFALYLNYSIWKIN